jgi:hypothetical protein
LRFEDEKTLTLNGYWSMLNISDAGALPVNQSASGGQLDIHQRAFSRNFNFKRSRINVTSKEGVFVLMFWGIVIADLEHRSYLSVGYIYCN